MKKLAISGLLALSMQLNVLEGADSALRDRMHRDLDFFKNTFEVKYAPADWKRSYSGWDLDNEVDLAKAKIDQNNDIDTKGYQRVLKGFFNGVKDYHVAIHFFSTEAASLPFMIQGANGRYFFSYVDKDAFVDGFSPFEVGDELLTFDGLPTDVAVSELKTFELSNNNPSTDQSLAEIFLTKRFGSAGMIVPQGTINITTRNSSNEILSCDLNWTYVPEMIKNPPQLTSSQFSISNLSKDKNKKSNSKSPFINSPFLLKQMAAPIYKHFLNPKTGKLEDENPHALGSRDGFLPNLGRKIWKSTSSDFNAYIYQNSEGRKIGFVRIPHYSGTESEAEDFFNIISIFEEKTDALVIDQLNNPGGSVFYLYALSSVLSNKPLVLPKQRISITQEEVAFALVFKSILETAADDYDATDLLGDSMDGYPVTFELVNQLISYFTFFIDQWEQGNFLTEPTYLYGIENIQPIKNPRFMGEVTPYTKPILFLVNSLDFSAGDFMPAILQDNNRVTVMGTRTAGAGGFVNGGLYPNRFGIQQFTFTGSIAERPNGQPIENLGVTPDIEYQITETDLQKNYQGLVQAIRKQINKMAAQPPAY
jgi:hypothetical protein